MTKYISFVFLFTLLAVCSMAIGTIMAYGKFTEKGKTTLKYIQLGLTYIGWGGILLSILCNPQEKTISVIAALVGTCCLIAYQVSHSNHEV